MAKVEMVIKLTRVYEPNPEDYPPGLSVQDMVEIDLEQIKEDPALLAELIAMGMFTVEATFWSSMGRCRSWSGEK